MLDAEIIMKKQTRKVGPTPMVLAVLVGILERKKERQLENDR